MKIVLDVLSYNANINELMHCADVFEEGKQLINHEQILITGSESMKVNELTENLKNAYENQKQNVVFISIRTIDNIGTIAIGAYTGNKNHIRW